MATFCLIFCKRFQYSPNAFHELLILGNSNSQNGKHQVPCIRLRIAPACSTWKSIVWSVGIMKQHFKGGLLCLLYFFPVCILHGFYFKLLYSQFLVHYLDRKSTRLNSSH